MAINTLTNQNTVAYDEAQICELVSRPLWIERPYALVSWLEMQKFSADAFFTIGKFLEGARHPAVPKSAGFISNENTEIGEERFQYMMGLVDAIRVNCEQIGLRQAVKKCLHIRSRLTITVSNRSVTQILSELGWLIESEMEDNLFLYVPEHKAQYYGKPELFGVLVARKFKSAAYDIEEAGNCYASSRPTACVFHLMRVLEIGLSALGKVFKVSLAHTNWHPAIEEIEKKIRDMGNDPNKAFDWKDQQEFYAQAASSFMFLKDAWRNYTAHARGKYTDQEAETIMINVRAFVQKLSEKLSD